MIWRKTLTWIVEWDDRARKELRKLDKQLQKDILQYLRKRIAVGADPRRFGKPLSYDKHGLWRYRVQNARIVCRIEDDEVIVLVLKVGYRKNVYND
jgi:mRNA interferase RelE/StbE